jgi:hypothetical protein
MGRCARLLLLPALLLLLLQSARAVDARFDLVGPRIDVRVTRGGDTLPIASVPNLQPGDRLWVHPDLPETQSVKYLLICVFLRGTTNPPPENWFIRINTWDKKVRDEGAFITVPDEAQQAVMFMAPETGGDFSTLKSAVRGRPGVFVRASQDLAEAGFEQARIEKYLASIRRVPAADPEALQKHSDLLARTLALKPNEDCFKRPVDTQFTCLTQTGSQTLLDDGHGNSVVNALSNGPSSDFIQAASYTGMAGAGLYSAYVGAIIDLIRLMGTLHTAQYQYIPAIAFPQGDSLNLRLNTPPSFHNPKSVLVIGLPTVQESKAPPLRPADAAHVACLLQPTVVLPIEGAPLVFSTALAHDLVLHLNTPPGTPAEPDIPLTPDAYFGGLVLQRDEQHHIPLHDHPQPLASADHPTDNPTSAPPAPDADDAPTTASDKPGKDAAPTSKPEPITLTGTIMGHWGFDSFTGPTVPLQQLPGTGWHVVIPDGATLGSGLIAGRSAQLLLSSTGTACVHTISARPTGGTADLNIPFRADPKPDQPNVLALTVPLEHELSPGDLHLAVQQYGQPAPDTLSAHTFSEPPTISRIDLHAGDKSLLLTGTHLAQVEKLSLGDLVFTPDSTADAITDDNSSASAPEGLTSLRLSLPAGSPTPPTQPDQRLTAHVKLRDGRSLSESVNVAGARPQITLLSKKVDITPASGLSLTDNDDIPLSSRLTFTLKSRAAFPRNGQVEIETLDGTLRTVLTLAPSGGLVLQDPHTVVATLDPLRSFGPSAFGALRLRAVYPPNPSRSSRHADSSDADNHPIADPKDDATKNPLSTDSVDEDASSDWLPLATLVRLPTLSQLQCPADVTQPCTLSGSNLFLIQSVSTDPAFANPQAIPDGFTGTILTVPHANASTLFLRLRDDPNPINSAVVAGPPPPPPVVAAKSHTSHSAEHTTEPTHTASTPKATPQSNEE